MRNGSNGESRNGPGGWALSVFPDGTFGSSNPNMSRIPMDPSVACLAMLTALLSAAMDLLDLEPAVPTVDAC